MPSQRGREFETEAIVLKVRTIGENDLWADFLTPDHGRLHGVARHGRKSRKRFGTVLESMNRVCIRYRETGGLVFLEEAGLILPAHHLEDGLDGLIAGFYVVDLVRELLPERSPDRRVYELLNETLLHIDRIDRTKENPYAEALMLFEYRFLDLCGYSPNLKKCLGCGRERNRTEKFFFVYREGGIYCSSCLPGGSSFEPLSRRTLPRILSRFIEYQLGHPPKSRKFLTERGFYA